ncbi:MAG: hypothetical protein WB709_05710 [Solirubrobacteraceae bacterium]
MLGSLTDLDRVAIQNITLDQVIETSTGVRVGGYLLQGAAAAALRAQRDSERARGLRPTEPLFGDARLARDGTREREDHPPSVSLEVKLARLGDSLDISFPQPQLHASFQPPVQETRHDAALILRLLRLTPSRALALATQHRRRKTDRRQRHQNG